MVFTWFFFDKCPPKTIKSLLSVTPLRNRSFGFRFYEQSLSRNLLTLWDTFAGVFRNETIKNLGCFNFHFAKDSGNFGGNSNGKVRFGFFRPEYSGSPMEIFHLFRSDIFRPRFAVPFLSNRSFALIREFGKELKIGKSHSY